MPTWNAFSFMFGPLVGFVALGVMIVILRWAFRRGESVVERPSTPGAPDEYGMLIPISAPSNYIQGELIRQQLADAGIRASLATTTDGPRVLIWPGDQARAKLILTQNLR